MRPRTRAQAVTLPSRHPQTPTTTNQLVWGLLCRGAALPRPGAHTSSPLRVHPACTQFGVLHDGRVAVPTAVAAVAHLAEAGVTVLIISNSSRRSSGTLGKLASLGYNPSHFAGAGKRVTAAQTVGCGWDQGDDFRCMCHPMPGHNDLTPLTPTTGVTGTGARNWD